MTSDDFFRLAAGWRVVGPSALDVGEASEELRRLAEELEELYNETGDADAPEEERKRRKGLRAPLAADRCALRAVCHTLDLYADRLEAIADERHRLNAEQAKIEKHRESLLLAGAGWGDRIRAQLNPPKTEGT